ncbi:hypothetical protein JX265_010951 [Neoarthrinium moseri]|uniref:Cation/H+ exchanger transmembrane domain-containing protein n=1 Tax=Neoarthrinium moseri TaxID=1658444 RepID=A0A9P9WDE5_9PEZI|nr:hypothetical protein JX265_010951 [Neoarthrinium moseri]
MAASMPYHEPGITDILVLSSFFLVLNVINSVLDKWLYCGLVGQVLIGIAWGTPGGKWLSSDLEHAIVQLGYLGLIMIVFEGGLSTSIGTMKANLLLSVCVALTGIAAPMALSFFLSPLVGASPIQCFAAGAALCSTSLGTTFTVLSTSGLVSTRLGSILSTAAMMDDVVGLVMVQIVASLGGGNIDISPATVIRPILVSLAFAVVLPLACRWILKPSIAKIEDLQRRHADGRVVKAMKTQQSVFIVQTALLLALVVGASYAGASVLLAAYLAGVIGAWWDERSMQVKAITQSQPGFPTAGTQGVRIPSAGESVGRDNRSESSSKTSQVDAAQPLAPSSNMYHNYYAPAIERVLKPFFFASIGFSIPISMMFTGPVVWRGVIYTILMLAGKAICGLWLVRFSSSFKDMANILCSPVLSGVRASKNRLREKRLIHDSNKTNSLATNSRAQGSAVRDHQGPLATVSATKTTEKSPAKPLSLYPAGILSFAMIARGEIGFLISSVAESNGIFKNSSSLTSSDEASEIFLIITWAIVLCTIIGPFCVGLLVRRVKRLEAESAKAQPGKDRRDVLGVWGVS